MAPRPTASTDILDHVQLLMNSNALTAALWRAEVGTRQTLSTAGSKMLRVRSRYLAVSGLPRHNRWLNAQSGTPFRHESAEVYRSSSRRNVSYLAA